VIEGAYAVAVPLSSRSGAPLGALAVVHTDPSRDAAKIAARLVTAAAALRDEMP